MNLLNKAAEAASTFNVLEPSDAVMAKNIRYYRNDMKILPEYFEPQQVSKYWY